MLQLVIAWTCVGVFVATAALTLLAVAGLIKLADKKYTDRLFKVLLVEIAVICLGVFTGRIELPETVAERCKDEGREELRAEVEPKIRAEFQRLASVAKAREEILKKQARGVTLTAAEKAKVEGPLELTPKVFEGIRLRKPRLPGR